MSKLVTVSQVGAEIEQILREYKKEVSEQVRYDVRIAGEVAARTTQDLAGSVLGGSGKDAGGWTHDTEESLSSVYDTTHNTSQPSLTHLLEHGHMTRSRKGWVAGRRHIADGAEAGFEELERRMRQ